MKYFISSFIALLITTTCFSQIIEGDQLLELVGKPVDDPLFQKLKTQETFYTNSWDEDFTIYISNTDNLINAVELENGKVKYGTKERYGEYKRALPWNLSWNMSAADFSTKLGMPVLVSTTMGFSNYKTKGWKITIFYENTKPVSIAFSKEDQSIPVKEKPVVVISNPPISNTTTTSLTAGNDWLVKLVNSDKAEMNWSVFKQMISNYRNIGNFAGKDSVDYIGEVYYSSQVKMPGFERVAVKRKKAKDKWYFESFLKIQGDSNKAKNTFFALYDAIKETIDANAKEDFILASSAKKAISESPMNWMAQWSLYSGAKSFNKDLGKPQLLLFISGLKNGFKNDQMDYTIKVYICDPSINIDFFTWDTPK